MRISQFRITDEITKRVDYILSVSSAMSDSNLLIFSIINFFKGF